MNISFTRCWWLLIVLSSFGRKGLKLDWERIVKLVEIDWAAAEVEAADHCGVGSDADKLLLGD
jgi:hypothetical protein